MDLEQLTKHQIILLTLLVSFVTSIATGIVTVALMQQAPPGVTRVVNQIIERTVQQVVPATQSATVEKTVVVKDEDLTAGSIASVQKSIVRVIAKGGTELVARGVIIDAKGTALTDRGALDASGATDFAAYIYSGELVQATLRASASTTAIAVLDLKVGTSTGFAPVPLANLTKLKLGSSVIRIGGVGADTVGEGVVAALPSKDFPGLIEASVQSVTPGSLLMTLFGEIVGISTTHSQSVGSDFYSTPSTPSNASSTPPTSP